jgi:branched-chain amino acid transport system permease protein
MGDALLVWVDTIVQGILLGGLYALYATGLSLIFGIMRLVNLAHGDLIVGGAFLILAIAEVTGLNTVVAFALSLPVMFAIGYGLQRYLLNRTLGEDLLPPLLVTFGLSIVIQNALLQTFSADTRRLPLGSISGISVPLGGGIAAGIMPLLSLVAAVIVVFGLNQLSYRTRLGRALRATSDDAETAQLMGINNARIYAVAMGLALIVCAFAAFFLGSRSTFDPTTGPARLIYAFEAVIIGGLGSLWGTLVGGIVVGIAQTVGARINPEWQILSGHVAFLVVLVLKPRGFFPRAFD